MNLVLTFTSGSITGRWRCPGTLLGLGGFLSLGWISATIGSTDFLTVPPLPQHTHTHTCMTHFWFGVGGGGMQPIYGISQFIVILISLKSHHTQTYQDMDHDCPCPGVKTLLNQRRHQRSDSHGSKCCYLSVHKRKPHNAQ